ncbi:MAG TPA: hypothetical protein VGP72_02425 [Planctomycetota bacterium]|jgi:outer membrane protein TolC
MMPLRILAALMVLLCNSILAENDTRTDPAAEALLSGALAQAQAIRPSAAQPGADQALQKLKEEIAAKAKLWSERVERRAGADDLLAGIPQAVRERASKLAPDTAATGVALKEGASLPLVLALVAERNPDVLAALQNWRASTRRFEQASFLEDLVSQFQAFTRQLNTTVGPQTGMPGVYPSSLALKGQIIDAEADIAWLSYLQTMRKMVNDTAKEYFELRYVVRSIANVRESRGLFAQMSESARSQLEAGNVSQSDVLKSQSELATLDTKIITLERQRVNQIAKINAMLSLPNSSEWGALSEEDLRDPQETPAELEQQATAGRHEVLAARRQVELMGLMVRMAEVEVTPLASVGYSQFSFSPGMKENAGMGSANAGSSMPRSTSPVASAGMGRSGRSMAATAGTEAGTTRSMPAGTAPTRDSTTALAGAFPEKPMQDSRAVMTYGANAAYIDELRVRINQMSDMAVLASNQAQFAAHDASFRADQAKREQETLASTVVPKSKQAYETLRERYSNNNVPLIEYLDAGRMYLDNSLMLQTTRRDHNQALVDLLDALGKTTASALPERP